MESESEAPIDSAQSSGAPVSQTRRPLQAGRPDVNTKDPDEAALTPGVTVPPLAGYVSDANDGPDQLDIE